MDLGKDLGFIKEGARMLSQKVFCHKVENDGNTAIIRFDKCGATDGADVEIVYEDGSLGEIKLERGTVLISVPISLCLDPERCLITAQISALLQGLALYEELENLGFNPVLRIVNIENRMPTTGEKETSVEFLRAVLAYLNYSTRVFLDDYYLSKNYVWMREIINSIEAISKVGKATFGEKRYIKSLKIGDKEVAQKEVDCCLFYVFKHYTDFVCGPAADKKSAIFFNIAYFFSTSYLSSYPFYHLILAPDPLCVMSGIGRFVWIGKKKTVYVIPTRPYLPYGIELKNDRCVRKTDTKKELEKRHWERLLKAIGGKKRSLKTKLSKFFEGLSKSSDKKVSDELLTMFIERGERKEPLSDWIVKTTLSSKMIAGRGSTSIRNKINHLLYPNKLLLDKNKPASERRKELRKALKDFLDKVQESQNNMEYITGRHIVWFSELGAFARCHLAILYENKNVFKAKAKSQKQVKGSNLDSSGSARRGQEGAPEKLEG